MMKGLAQEIVSSNHEYIACAFDEAQDWWGAVLRRSHDWLRMGKHEMLTK